MAGLEFFRLRPINDVPNFSSTQLAFCVINLLSLKFLAVDMHRVFVYGTLKKGQPNFYLLEDAAIGLSKYVGDGVTVQKWPLVVGTPYNIPFILDNIEFGKVKTILQ